MGDLTTPSSRCSWIIIALCSHGHRPPTYDETDYFNEFGVVVNAVQQDAKIKSKNKLIAPSVQGQWTPEDVWNTGFLDSYGSSLDVIAMEQYVALSSSEMIDIFTWTP